MPYIIFNTATQVMREDTFLIGGENGKETMQKADVPYVALVS